ncbi:MAG TPA: squalene--hopene cyclase [Pirellulales bacterium]|nr:squalene--hopene cyclase [Pirellulales bacterium]
MVGPNSGQPSGGIPPLPPGAASPPARPQPLPPPGAARPKPVPLPINGAGQTAPPPPPPMPPAHGTVPNQGAVPSQVAVPQPLPIPGVLPRPGAGTAGNAPPRPRPLPAQGPAPVLPGNQPPPTNPAAHTMARPQPLPAGAPAAPGGVAPRPITLPPGTPPASTPIAAGVAAKPAVRTGPEHHDTAEEKLKKFSNEFSTPVLISAAVHMLLIIILGLIGGSATNDKNVVTLQASYAEEEGQQLLDPSQTAPIDTPIADSKAMAETLPVVSNPFAEAPKIPVDTLFGGLAAGGLGSTSPLPIALAGRDRGMKSMLLGTYGGSDSSEAAVKLGLEWLSKQQMKSGMWSLKGPYTGGATFENHEAATAMALLAFQGAGHTHRTGKFKANVQHGLEALLKQQYKEGNFYRGEQRDEGLYTQAQCTIAVCELWAMTQDSALRAAATRAVQYCIDAQAEEGGWRYTPRNDSDTSVTGWMVMALQSAKMGGIEVPQKVLDRIGVYLDSASPDGGSKYTYLAKRPESDATRSMTAEGLLCRQYLGWKQDDPRLIRGIEILLDPANRGLPDWTDRDHYYWYYATQVMHHMEGPYWPRWNNVYRDMLVKHQEKKGKEAGSWEPLGSDPDIWCQRGQGGRLYCTCLSLFTLEVYYRHLPLYSSLKKQLEGTRP